MFFYTFDWVFQVHLSVIELQAYRLSNICGSCHVVVGQVSHCYGTTVTQLCVSCHTMQIAIKVSVLLVARLWATATERRGTPPLVWGDGATRLAGIGKGIYTLLTDSHSTTDNLYTQRLWHANCTYWAGNQAERQGNQKTIKNKKYKIGGFDYVVSSIKFKQLAQQCIR